MALETGSFIDDLVATNPVSATDLVRFGAGHLRLLKDTIKNSFAGSGGAILVAGADSSAAANTITLTPTPSLTEYTTRMLVLWHQAVTNTGATTMNISGLGAKSVVSVANAALASGDLVAGRAYLGEYDGTSVQLLAVTKNYVDQQAFSAALPAQSLGLLISNGTTASFSKTFTGFAVNTVRATVASHATTSAIWAATGNEIDFTGAETITNFPAADVAGASRILHCASTPIFTNNANISVQGAANYTAEAGDIVTVHAITTTTFRVTVEKANGRAVSVSVEGYGACNGRLTLTSGTAVTTADVTAATTVYFTPYGGDKIGTYSGSAWSVSAFTEKSVAVPATTNTPFDVFIVDSTLALETVDWTNDTTRATALTTQNGVLVKTGATTRRYLGTLRTTGVSGQTEDSYAKRYCWNYYNRTARPMKVVEATGSWTYTTDSYRQARASTANQLDFVIGYSEDLVKASVVATFSNDVASPNGAVVGIGLDSTTVSSATVFNRASVQVGGNDNPIRADYVGLPGVGRHFLAWLERSKTGNTTTWLGDADGAGNTPAVIQSGIFGEMWG